jgi:hypothetical protein
MSAVPVPPYALTQAEREAWDKFYIIGYNRGLQFPQFDVPKVGDPADISVGFLDGPFVTEENVRDYHFHLCMASEANARFYSPFEFTAKEINSNEHLTEVEGWDAYDSGVADGIYDGIKLYSEKDYR